MSLTRAKEYLKKFELDDKVMELPVSSATVEETLKKKKLQKLSLFL